MGLFKHKRPPLNTWIRKVDMAYTRAFETMDVSEVAQYMSRPLAMRVFENVRHGEKEYSGLSRYRSVTWRKAEESGSQVTMLKVVTYNHIKVTRGIIAAVGADYIEQWLISKLQETFEVTDIRRVS